MSQQSDEEILIRSYLLGGLDEEVQEQVEERLLCDGVFAERVSAAQDNLIDDYVFDVLPEGERESFEKNFHLTDERRKKVLFAQAMEIYLDERHRPQPSPTDDAQPPPPWWKHPLLFLLSHKVWSAVCLAFVLLLLFMVPRSVDWLKSPEQVTSLRAQRANVERQVAEVNKRPADPRTQALASLELPLQPTILREGSGMKRVTLTGDIKLLNLKLALPQARQGNYRALVLTAEDEELFAVEGLTPEVDAGVATVLLKIPSEFIHTGDYQVQLRRDTAGDDNVVRYYFRVIKT